MSKLKHLAYLMFHPFDGFFEARFRGKGSTLLAAIILVAYGVTQIAQVQYTGFIINYYHLYGLESSELFLSGVLPVILFVVSNWSVTTLMNGNGRFRDVFMVTCYSLLPLIATTLLAVLASNAMILEETIILSALNLVGVVWFLILMFSGLCVVHEYSASRNIFALVATVVAALVLLFLVVLYLTLMDGVRGFVDVISTEIMNRLRR